MDDIERDEHSALIRRLQLIVELDKADRLAIRDLPLDIHTVLPNEDIVTEGVPISRCCLLLEGFAFRYSHTRDGKRQIIAFHVPGDIPDLQSLHLHWMDHSLCAAAPSRVAYIPHQELWRVCRERERVAAAFWLETVIEGAIFREWIVGLGRRSGRSRTAHLLCELAVRMGAVGPLPDNVFTVPLTQNELADALGLTAVTVNRVLQEFKSEKLVERERSRMIIRNWRGLARIGEFDPGYLHMRGDLDLVAEIGSTARV